MKLIDLSLPIDDSHPEAHPIRIDRLDHKNGIAHLNRVLMKKTLKGRLAHLMGKRVIKPSDLPDGEFLSLEMVYCSVHTGTHVDASFHFGTHCEGGPAKQIDDLPLDWFYGDGVALDMTHKKPGEVIEAIDIALAAKKIGYTIKPKDIVFLRTGADKFFGTKDYLTSFPGVSPDALSFLMDKGVRVVGTDALGFDRPYPAMFKDFIATGDKSVLWPAHFFGRKKAYAHIERLANLDKLPRAHGFKVTCFPIRIRKAGAAFARVVAMIKED
jgi:kynurenine formamidase